MAVLLIGTLDTKGRELEFLRDRLRSEGLRVLVIDAGSGDPVAIEADYPRDRVFEAAGSSLDSVHQHRDRGRAVTDAARGVARLVEQLVVEDNVEGILAIGGSAGTTIGTSAMRAAPFGLPKVMVSTLASGQTRPYVGGSDLMMLPSIADLAGLNGITRRVLTNAADAMIGMVQGQSKPDLHTRASDGKLITATMFGVTTPCVDRARNRLESQGAEVIVFHATGVGGQAMEQLIRDGLVDGVLDLTTTELADELVGGVLSAGPDRLSAAVSAGIPQVVSVGALDMVNFGPLETVPEIFRGRLLHLHNPTVTLMRTQADECEAIGHRMAQALRNARVETVVLIPELGVSALDAPGQPFFDPEADAALFSAIREGLKGSTHTRVESLPMHLNDPAFADVAVERLLAARKGMIQ
ncbi:Tm-1-like ATP-binding domain-containing protein [Tautonia rosea]|uniref:Tm-1-like ATP-binding domain-containing protein n=1 Tax=Tautonia rosea TaxID=2728037 RepID=UPI001472B285|nr:Tm-1-like ATP-binding domain-containing protein [Tautonia rosea]